MAEETKRKSRRSWRLGGVVDRGVVISQRDLEDDEQPLRVPPQLRQRLEQAAGHPMLGQRLVELARVAVPGAVESPGGAPNATQRRMLVAQVDGAFRQGLLLIVPEAPAVWSAPREQAPPPEASSTPAKKPKAKTWIEFKVVEEGTGKPVSGVRLRVTTPDGIENFYTTRSDGTVRIAEIDEGTCDLGEVVHAEALEVVSFS